MKQSQVSKISTVIAIVATVVFFLLAFTATFFSVFPTEQWSDLSFSQVIIGLGVVVTIAVLAVLYYFKQTKKLAEK
jgi:uncharacterized PurR-regulated membrane protein YhhQ (DUF165 family)